MTAVQQAVDEEEDPAQEKVKEGCIKNYLQKINGYEKEREVFAHARKYITIFLFR